MCGIAGLWDTAAASSAEELAAATSAMSDALLHRGPDGSGVWTDSHAGIALAHRRLAIVELSPLGRQPMLSGSNRFAISYNGEIYNFRRLRRDLERAGERFRGQSDTEVLLAAIERWGLMEALERSVGMFAFALWDRKERSLHLARDRLGKKPLYFGWADDHFLLASELKALRAYDAFDAQVDLSALALYLRHSCVPAPYSIYRGVFKLPPGALLTLPSGCRARGAALLERIERYWSALEVAERGIAYPLHDVGEDDARDMLEQALDTAVTERMIADVPLGALLSGGIDSSTVVALMQKHSTAKVRTFSIGFREPRFDEAADAARVAAHLGTEHNELYVTAEDALAVIPRVPELYDEPFGDQSQVPTFLVSQFARGHVTVALSGDGGDEAFGGYQRHFYAERLARISRLPALVRGTAARSLTALSSRRWDELFSGLGSLLPAGMRRELSGERLHKLADVLIAATPESAYRVMASHWHRPGEVLRPQGGAAAAALDEVQLPPLASIAHAMMALDTVTYLPDDVLTKVDRASMAVALEVRAPLLDHRVVELAWRLPLTLKIRNGQGKWILRSVLERYVPRPLFDRPKHGFGIPVGDWLRGPLREWTETLLAERRLQDEGFFEPQPIREAWAQHLAGRRNRGYHLWDVLMFQAWAERWLR